jgi:hypothetical protein
MIYQIKVRGQLDESWSDWLGDVQITSALAEDGTWVTTLVSAVPDPPALFGILDRIRDLNLALISLREMGGEESQS